MINFAAPLDANAPDRFLACTEVAGEPVSLEQVERMAHRYHWAARFCADKDVVEVACGTGQGLGYLRSRCRSLRAGDISKEMVRMARERYADEDISIQEMAAETLPFPDASADVVLLFEAIYYLPEPERFVQECRRILRPGGKLLIATANPDLYDFTRSPFSHRYYGAADLPDFLGGFGFRTRMFGDTPLAAVGLRQRMLRPLKAMAARMNLIPGSMRSKQLLKRLFFGALVQMPARITADTASRVDPVPLPPLRPDREYKVLFCEATLAGPDHA